MSTILPIIRAYMLAQKKKGVSMGDLMVTILMVKTICSRGYEK